MACAPAQCNVGRGELAGHDWPLKPIDLPVERPLKFFADCQKLRGRSGLRPPALIARANEACAVTTLCSAGEWAGLSRSYDAFGAAFRISSNSCRSQLQRAIWRTLD